MKTALFRSLLIAVCQLAISGLCPCGWKQYGQSCYWFELADPGKSFEEAEKYCNNLPAKAHLISLNSADEQTFVNNEVVRSSQKNYWIGLQRQSTNAPWTWMDGSGVSFENWAYKEPGLSDIVVRCDPNTNDWIGWGEGSLQLPFVCEITQRENVCQEKYCWQLFNEPRLYLDAIQECTSNNGELLTVPLNNSLVNELTAYANCELWVTSDTFQLSECPFIRWTTMGGDHSDPTSTNCEQAVKPFVCEIDISSLSPSTTPSTTDSGGGGISGGAVAGIVIAILIIVAIILVLLFFLWRYGIIGGRRRDKPDHTYVNSAGHASVSRMDSDTARHEDFSEPNPDAVHGKDMG